MGELIRFPVERRRSEIVGTALNDAATGGTVSVQLTQSWPSASGALPPPSPAWWARVPPVVLEIENRAMWMKLGVSPTQKAKRHRVIRIITEQTAAGPLLIADAACGRSAPLSLLFDDKWSGGDCVACRRKGWR